MTHTNITFFDLGLNSSLVKTLNTIGYTTPSPIQVTCIPYLLRGNDVLGMAQTGSGKTAAFALPLLHNIKININHPQILVLTPTRELAVQVANAFATFSKNLIGIHILAVYGGQKYDLQLRSLRRGPHIVVGTPGRLLDHLKRGTLNLSYLTSLVLDEADEMLRMGFIEDVETIMSKVPKVHQTALFSATMPEVIRRISKRFMKNPKEVRIQSSITTRPDIQQSYWVVYGKKTDALIRFLEVEDFSAIIIFVRTKNATLEISDVLEKNGYNSAALNGDMNQTLREQTLTKLRDGRLDILIATDVAARGLDVDRISLVINYDIPMDSESYVHRIGRTGRAGRKGKALLFVENRERRLLRNIERVMKISIKEISLPKSEFLSKRRLEKFSEKVKIQLESKDLNEYRKLLLKLIHLNDKLEMELLAAALLKIAQGERSLIVKPDVIKDFKNIRRRETLGFRYSDKKKFMEKTSIYNKNKNFDLYRVGIGRSDGVEIRHIINAISNKGDINNRNIGNIRLFSNYSTLELKKGLSEIVCRKFTRVKILNKYTHIKLLYNRELKDTSKYNIPEQKIYNNRRLHTKQVNKKFTSTNSNFKKSALVYGFKNRQKNI